MHWLNLDVPYVPLDKFVEWVSDEGIDWANALRPTTFLSAMQSWIEWFFVVFVQTGRIEGEVPGMGPGIHQSVFIRSKHFTERAEREAQADLLDWIVPIA